MYILGLTERSVHETDGMDLIPSTFGPSGNHYQLREPADAIFIETPEEKVTQHVALMSVSWGVLSDVDIRSENFRCLGHMRFLVAVAVSILGRSNHQNYVMRNHCMC